MGLKGLQFKGSEADFQVKLTDDINEQGKNCETINPEPFNLDRQKLQFMGNSAVYNGLRSLSFDA